MNKPSSSRTIDMTNAEIDRKAKVSTVDEYVQSLSSPRAGPYWVRPDGTIEMEKLR